MPHFISSREFNQDVGRAKKVALQEPVFITDRGRPAHVILSIEAYQKLANNQPSIVELLAMENIDKCDFDAPRLDGALNVPELL